MNPTKTAIESPGPIIGSFRLPQLRHARVKDAMRPGVITVSPKTPLREVARILAAKHIHCVVVVGDDALGRPQRCGVISALDLLAAAAGTDIAGRTAADLVAGEPCVVGGEDDLEQAAKLMAERHAEHLLVLDADDGRPVGVLSTLDVAGVLAWGEA